jgi:pilus assembly protein CpaE
MNLLVYTKNKDVLSKIKSAAKADHVIKHLIEDEDQMSMALASDPRDVVIIDILEITDRLVEAFKNNPHYTIAVSAEANVEHFKKALQIEAKDLLNAPLKKEDINTAFEKANYYIENSQNIQKSIRKKSAKTITFLSSKGGVGKSVVIANLAYMLQKNFEKQMLLIDSIPRFGNLDVLLDISEKKSISQIPGDLEDEESLWHEVEANICVHPSGIHVLKAGERIDEPMEAVKLKQILNVLQDKYDFILIDTAANFNDFNLAMIEYSTAVYFLSTLSIASIRNLNFGLETIKSIYYSTDKVKILINRYNKNGELTIPDVEKFLKHKIAAVIPDNYETVIKSVNKGVPFVAENNTDPELMDAIKIICGMITGQKVSIDPSKMMKEESSILKQLTSIFSTTEK